MVRYTYADFLHILFYKESNMISVLRSTREYSMDDEVD